MTTVPNPPIQESPEVISVEMRKTLGGLFGQINRMVPAIDGWAARDKKNTSALNKVAENLRQVNTNLKGIIVENEKLSGLSTQGLDDLKQQFQYTHKNKSAGQWVKPPKQPKWKGQLQQQAKERGSGSWRDELARQSRGE